MVSEPVRDEEQGGQQQGGPGEIMRKRRIQMGLDTPQVAERLHLSQGIIEAIDNDDFESLPEPAYVRGYIRAYARMLDLDHEPLLARYNALAPAEPQINFSEFKPREKAHNLTMRWGTLLVSITLLALLIVWFVNQRAALQDSIAVSDADLQQYSQPELQLDSSRLEPLDIKSLENELAAQPISANARQADELTSESSSEAPSEITTESGLMVQLPVPATASTGSAAMTSRTAAGDSLTLTYLADSWAEIRDANDTVLAKGLIRAGTVQTLQGEAPFRCFLGNATVVEIKMNNKPFDHSKFIRANKTARFNVAASR